jgi:2-dehydropantoate 2-reductase
MKFVIFGSGGVGGYFGGKLALAGQDVVFVARGEHLEAIQKNGLRVDSILGDFVVKDAKATDNPVNLGEVDAIILAVKAWSVPEAIEKIRPFMGKDTFIVWLGNGIEATDQLVNAFGQKHVLGGLCHISSFIAGPGHIQHVGIQPHLAFGELDNSRSARVQDLLQIFSSIPEIQADIPEDILLAIWTKFVFIAATSGVGAVTRVSMGAYRNVPQTRAILLAALEESVRIGRARGIAFEDAAAQTILKYEIDAKAPGVVASMQKAIMEGKPSELDNQTGMLVRLGRELGVPTPTHAFIYAALLPMELKARGKV